MSAQQSKPILRRPPPLLPQPSTTKFASSGKQWPPSRPRHRSSRRRLYEGGCWRPSQSGSARRFRWRTTVFAAAAAIAIGLGALSAGLALRSTAPLSTPAQVFAAGDVRTVSGAMPAGGTATVVYSREKNAGVLVMNNVPPPSSGTVYQMWLMGDNGAKLAGTMDAKSVAPSTTAVILDIGKSNALAFSVEPSPGSTRPTGPVIAELPLT